MKSLETLIEQLSEPVSMEQAAAPGGLPYQPGLYLWWVRQRDALRLRLVAIDIRLHLRRVDLEP